MTMRQWLMVGCAIGLLGTAQGVSAQTAKPDFPTILDQDVAGGRLTADQANDLKTQYEAVGDRFSANLDRAGNGFATDIRRNVTANPELLGQIGTISDGRVASSPADVLDQATSVYNAGEKAIQLNRNLIDSVRPALEQGTSDFDRIVAERTELINNNPNVSARDRHDAQTLATQVHGWATYTVEHRLSTDLAKINAAESDYQNHKAEIITAIATGLKTNADRYGPAIANWPKPAAPAPTAVAPPAQAQQPARPDSRPATPAPTPAATPPARPSAPSATTTRGSVPSNGADPALSATRNGSAATGQSGSGTAASSGTTAAPASSARPTASTSQGRTAAPRAPTPPSATPPPATPPPPRTNPLTVKPTHLPPLTVTAPPPERPSDKVDDTAVTIRDPAIPPPSVRDGRGVDPDAPPPASPDTVPPVAQPSQQPISDLPAPVHPRRGTVPSDAPDPAFDAHRNDPNYDPDVPSLGQTNTAGQNGSAPNQSAADAVADAAAQGGQTGRSTPNGADAAAQAAASAQAGASLPSAANAEAAQDAARADYIRSHNIPGNAHLVDGEPEFGADVASLRAMLPPSLAGFQAAPSVEYGGTLTVATLAPIYAGYDLNRQPGQALRSLDLHPPVPSAIMIVPSNQIEVPSTWINIPSTWADVPSLVTVSLDLQPALCGR